MIKCSCGKTIEKVPAWLEGAKVEFVCYNCPNRTAKNIAFVSLETEAKASARAEDPEVEVEEVPDDLDEE